MHGSGSLLIVRNSSKKTLNHKSTGCYITKFYRAQYKVLQTVY